MVHRRSSNLRSRVIDAADLTAAINSTRPPVHVPAVPLFPHKTLDPIKSRSLDQKSHDRGGSYSLEGVSGGPAWPERPDITTISNLFHERSEAKDSTALIPSSSRRERPQARLWYGFLRLQSRKMDALDYYEEKLQRLDGKISVARKKSYEAADLAFVTTGLRRGLPDGDPGT